MDYNIYICLLTLQYNKNELLFFTFPLVSIYGILRTTFADRFVCKHLDGKIKQLLTLYNCCNSLIYSKRYCTTPTYKCLKLLIKVKITYTTSDYSRAGSILLFFCRVCTVLVVVQHYCCWCR